MLCEDTDAVKKFLELVDHYRYQQGPNPQSRGQTNFTFWAGAGFSKSWDPKAPVGSELFQLETRTIRGIVDTFSVPRIFDLDSFNGISHSQLRQIVYQLDMYQKYPDIRPRYVDDQNLRLFNAALRTAVLSRYQEIAELNYFDSDLQKFPYDNPTKAQGKILWLFRFLLDQIDGSQPQVEGIRTHFITTNYDYVIETILDNILAIDDSLFLYTYRGITPTHIAGLSNVSPMHQHWLVQHLLKINGGFEILRNGDNYMLDYRNRKIEDVLEQPPVLMLPSREQDYSSSYFRTIFPKAVRLLRETKVLVLVGYSLPKDDALIRFILRQFAEEPEDGRGKWLFYVGPESNRRKRKVIEKVFPTSDPFEENSPMLCTFEGGFEAFAGECCKLAK